MGFSRDFSVTVSASIIVTILAFSNNVIVTRYLGPDGRGTYSIISYAVVFLVLILGEGIRRLNTITIGKEPQSLVPLVKFNLRFMLIISFLLFVFYIFGYNQLNKFLNLTEPLFALTLMISFFFILWQIIQAILLGYSNIIKFNLLQVSSIGLILIFNFIGIYFFKIGLIEIVTNLLAATFFTFLISGIFLNKYFNLNNEPLKINYKKSLSLINKSTISAILIFIILKGDIFVINYYLGSYSAGIYSIGIICSEIFQKVPNVIGPLVISRTVADDSTENSLRIAKLVRVTIILNFFLICILVLFGYEIIIFLFKIQFAQAFEIIILLIPALFSFGPGAIIYSYFMGKAYPVTILLINLFFGLMSILLDVIMIPKFGISAAAIISSVTYFLWALSLIFYFNYDTKIQIKDLLLFKKEDFVYILSSLKKKKY